MNDLQRSREWFLLRKGHITASEVYILLANHKEDMTPEELAEARKLDPKSRARTKEAPFSQGTFTYLDTKVAELFMPEGAFIEYVEDTQQGTRATRWGTTFEDKARETYSSILHKEIVDAPFIPLVGYERFAGGSPDGINQKDGEIIEIKCPYNPAVHLRHYLYETQHDLKADNLQYYCQVQYNMIVAADYLGRPCTGADFISYDPRTSVSKQLKVLHIEPDEEVQQQLLERTRLAVDYMAEQVRKVNQAKAF